MRRLSPSSESLVSLAVTTFRNCIIRLNLLISVVFSVDIVMIRLWWNWMMAWVMAIIRTLQYAHIYLHCMENTSTCPPVLDGFGQVASVLLWGSRNLLPNWSQGVDLSSWALWAPAGSFQSCMGSARVGSRSLRLWHNPRATSHEPKQDSSDCGVDWGYVFLL